MYHSLSQIKGVWQGADGRIAEVIYDGAGSRDGDVFSAIRELKDPARKLAVEIVLSDHSRIQLPFKRIPSVLADGSGVVVVFGPLGADELSDVSFNAPDNAAVYNLDGTLRFQLINPEGFGTSFFSLSGGNGRSLYISVRPDGPGADFVNNYQVDGDSANLSKLIPKAVRL